LECSKKEETFADLMGEEKRPKIEGGNSAISRHSVLLEKLALEDLQKQKIETIVEYDSEDEDEMHDKDGGGDITMQIDDEPEKPQQKIEEDGESTTLIQHHKRMTVKQNKAPASKLYEEDDEQEMGQPLRAKTLKHPFQSNQKI
jgi:hypothetical protein